MREDKKNKFGFTTNREEPRLFCSTNPKTKEGCQKNLKTNSTNGSQILEN